MGILEDKTAIVTGGGGGVGRGISLALAKEGAKVVVLDLVTETAEQVAQEVTDAGGVAVPLTCDISTSAAIETAVAAVVEQFGTVDILVNNAQGARPDIAIEDLTDDDLDLFFSTGPLATVRFMRTCFPYLKRSGSGRVINLRSGSEIPGMAGFGGYVAAKGAIYGFTKVAAREWGKYGITVNALAPAVVSDAAKGYFEANPETYDRLMATLSIPRFGDAEADAGRAAVFLAGPDSGYITGCTIAADGGGGFFG